MVNGWGWGGDGEGGDIEVREWCGVWKESYGPHYEQNNSFEINIYII